MSSTTSTTIPGTPAIVVDHDLRVVELERRLVQLEEDFDKLKWFVIDNIKKRSDRIG